MIEQLKEATPLVALWLDEGVHVSVPLAGLVPMAIPIVAEELVTTFPYVSSTETPVAKLAPAFELEAGCEVMASFDAVAGLIVSLWVPEGDSPVLDTVSVGEPATVSP